MLYLYFCVCIVGLFMIKLGVFHPPAGGAALAYSSGAFSFGFYLLMVSISALFIIPATMINNLSKKRQYPTYWI
jgi:CBS-domain-containing membrane protein